MKLEIKEGTLNQLDFLIETRLVVLKEVFNLSEKCDKSVLETENRFYYERAISEKSHIAALAYQQGVFVGCGGLCIQEQMPSPDCKSGKYGFIMNMYTVPNYRGQGIAKKILTWLIDEGKKVKVERFILETTEHGRFVYEKSGFIASAEFMTLQSTQLT